MLKPFIKEYTNDVQLESDIAKLKTSNVHKDDIYVLAHDSDRTSRISNKAGTNTIGMSEMGVGSAVGSMFKSTGDELRTKLEEIGFSKDEASRYESHLDQGKVLLIVQNHDNAGSYLI